MPFECFMLKGLRRVKIAPGASELLFTLPDGNEVNFENCPPGAMWENLMYPEWVGPRNLRDVRTDRGLNVIIPGKAIWHLEDKGSDGTTWSVHGDAPKITVSPSIRYSSLCHIILTNGVIGDDLDGRKFNELGILINV